MVEEGWLSYPLPLPWIWLKENMVEENISQEFILKNIDETTNYNTEEMNQTVSMSKKHENV